MANVDRPNGLYPVKRLDGADWNAMLRKYVASDRSADTTGNHGDIYVGDPVKFASGLVLPANSGDTIIGVVVGVGSAPQFGDGGPFVTSDLSLNYLAHSATGNVWVCPKENVLFMIQTASDLDLVAGDAPDITIAAATAHGSRVTGYSNCELTTASNNDVTVVEDPDSPDNDVSLVNARHLVKIN